MGYYENTRDDIEREELFLSRIETAIDKLPEGKVEIKTISGRQYYYFTPPGEKRRRYIRRSQEDLVEKLCCRKQPERTAAVLKTNITARKKLLKKYSNYDAGTIEAMLPTAYRYVSKAPYHPEKLIHKTTAGIFTRSKGEALIVELLCNADIEFEYEKELWLEDFNGDVKKAIPDFTITNKDGSFMYWEHFGMMDLPEYRKSMIDKLALYHYNNILCPNNLIITMESKDGAIDIAAIDKIINGIIK